MARRQAAPSIEDVAVVNLGDVRFAAGVAVIAGVANVPNAGPMPAIVFRFVAADGRPYPPISLVVEDVDTFIAAKALKDAANRAVRAAKQARVASGLG